VESIFVAKPEMKVTEKRFLNIHNSIGPLSPQNGTRKLNGTHNGNEKAEKLLMVSEMFIFNFVS
jgi:hypothetical protein